MSTKKFAKGDKDLYENVFDGLSYYPTIGSTYHLNRSKFKVQQFYLEGISKVKEPKVLDVGCYIGTDLFMLPKPNPKAKYWGVDVSEDAIGYAKNLSKKRGETDIEFKQVDANKPLPFPDKYFDVVMALELIEHLHNPDQFLSEIKRVLKKDGCLIISTPNEERFANSLVKHLPAPLKKIYDSAREKDFSRHGKKFHLNPDVWDNEAHISLNGYSKWEKIFRIAGFGVEKVDGSSIYGGTRVIGDRPFLLGLTILLDAFIDKIPFKPYLQMCLVVKLKQNHHVN